MENGNVGCGARGVFFRSKRDEKLSEEYKQARNQRHSHNAKLGHVARATIAMEYISRSETSTEESKILAREISVLLDLLSVSLAKRNDSK